MKKIQHDFSCYDVYFGKTGSLAGGQWYTSEDYIGLKNVKIFVIKVYGFLNTVLVGAFSAELQDI